MDNQFEKWQAAYQQQTPKVDTSALLNDVKATHRKETQKAWVDLLSGIAVSIFVLYTAIFVTESTLACLLLSAVVPVPMGFSVWSFVLRRRGSDDTQSVAALLAEKKRQLQNKVKYWKVSAIGIAVLWIALTLVCGVFWFGGDHQTMWLVLPVIQLLVVLATWGRYVVVKRQLPVQLRKITALYTPSDK
ncbi:hypothetical protein FJ444_13315 [Aestuariibacter sp. GS-14]|uniref:hypothetical protein n=1 Tax=Aestuariibacter sp. GS-14 TaxID=2590670 RepID=UPI00112E3847|nr:hypothetical protein [Aestuariibacter sp. GS-14]TPV57366.1 hypothetical protein FJ444_13315 [Aestuariibacter sp. GS-14]